MSIEIIAYSITILIALFAHFDTVLALASLVFLGLFLAQNGIRIWRKLVSGQGVDRVAIVFFIGTAIVSIALMTSSYTREYLTQSVQGNLVRVWSANHSWQGPLTECRYKIGDRTIVLPTADARSLISSSIDIANSSSEAIVCFVLQANRHLQVSWITILVDSYKELPENEGCSYVAGTSPAIGYVAIIDRMPEDSVQKYNAELSNHGVLPMLVTIAEGESELFYIWIRTEHPGIYSIAGIEIGLEHAGKKIVKEISVRKQIAFR
jgi:hypothetical protein